MNVLITGSTGFLGTSLARRLRNDSTIKLSLLSQHGDQKINSVAVNLENLTQTKKYLSKVEPDVIFHTAAHVNLTRDYKTAKKCFDANLLATLNVLESIKEFPPKKFIFISTEEIYGNNKIPYSENQNPQPPSMYSISKVAGEQLCKLYSEQIGFQVIVARLATFYGPGDRPHRLIPTIIKNALNNEKILLNSGTKRRDYIYIDDAITALVAMLHAKTSSYEIINIGAGKNYSLIEVVEEIISQTKSTSEIVRNAFPDRIGEADEWLMDLSRAKRLLKWTPHTTLKTGISQTLASLTSKQ